MASNERKNARKEKIEKKNKRNRTIVWIILIIVVAALLIMKVCEIDFKDVKNRFTDADGNFTLSVTADVDSYPYLLDSSGVIDIRMFNDKLDILTDTSLSVIEPTDAKKRYSFDHGYAEPIIAYNGSYICTIDQGGYRLRLDTNSDNKYETTFDNAVLCADVARNGNVAYATQSPDCKSQVVVVTSSLKKVFTYNHNDGYVTDIAIDPSGKRLACVLVNSDNGELVSTVVTYNVGDDIPRGEFKFIGANIIDLHYSSSDLFVLCDNALSVITSQKRCKPVFDVGSICVQKYAYASGGDLILNYSKYQGADSGIIAAVSSNGKLRTQIHIKKRVVSLSTTGNKIVALFDDRANVYSISNGEKRQSFTIADGTKAAVLIGRNLYVLHGQMIEIKE